MSRKDFGAKPYLFPMPVLIIGTYDENGIANAMNAAWGMITGMNEITISLSPHKTTKNLEINDEYTVSIGTASQVVECDYVGIESANNVPNKVEKCGWHAIKSEHVNAPLFEELPMALECKLKKVDGLLYIGEIVNVCADESVLTGGEIDVAKLDPIAFETVGKTYTRLGEVVGQAFSDGKKLK
ncbi:MAG: flavin reductase family protein [Coriobacteriales bacterium]|nr:flavin reductase family protein [Coriobacteriales bacterium]